MIPERSSFSPGPNTSIKARFTNRFLRALKRLNKHRSNSTTTGRYRMVKVAADASMASAVGSKKAWSRAMLWKIRSRQQQRTARVLGIRRRSRARVLRRRCHVEDKPAAGNKFGFGGVHQLRKLVPGGETMDLESLLLETAHYVKCLSTQVQVMRDIVDFCST